MAYRYSKYPRRQKHKVIDESEEPDEYCMDIYEFDQKQKFEIFNATLDFAWIQRLFYDRYDILNIDDQMLDQVEHAISDQIMSKRFRIDYDNIISSHHLVNMLYDDIVNSYGCLYMSNKYITTRQEDEPRSMVMLCKVINETVIVKFTISTEQGWMYQYNRLINGETTKYKRESIMGLFLWTIDQIRSLYPELKYGAIETATKGSEQLMEKAQQYGYSEIIDYTHDDVKEKPFILPTSERQLKRLRVNAFVFEFCHMCIKPPSYTCGDIKCCSRECAEKFYLKK